MAKTVKLMFVVGWLAAGCAGVAGSPTAPGSTDEEVAASSSALELQGSWRTFCNANAAPGSGSFARELSVSGDHLTYLQYAYADASCTDLSSVVTLESQLSVGQVLAGSSSARQLDERIMRSTLAVLTEPAALEMNQRAMCGHTDWHAAESRAVSECALAAGKVLAEGDTVHAVYLRATDNELRLADGSRGATLSLAVDAAQRPAAASNDPANVYYKQASSSASE